MSSTEKKPDEELGAQAHVKPAESAATEAKKPVEDDVGDVPDPDEDDLDDLDDMLDEFSNTKLNAQPAAEAPKANSQPKTEPSKAAPELPTNPEDEVLDEDFAKQLQAGMAEMLADFEKSPDMKQQFEDIFKQMGAAEGEPGVDAPSKPSADGAKSTASPSVTDASFQDTIRKTMERMQSSGDQATAAATSGNEDDFLAQMLNQLGGEGGGGGEEDFSKMIMGMMEQLTNKDILYEPMKELSEKFPEWLEKNKATTSQEDLKRYEEQQRLATEMVAKFEEETYADSNVPDREYILERMQKMQEAGSPPSDLVGDMPSAQEAFNGPDESCNPQ